MKCPQCGIHYDDSERECPMCGARKPAFQKDASRLAKTTGELAQPSASRQNKTSKTSKAAMQTASLGGNAERNTKRGTSKIIVLIVILAVVAINVIPRLFSVMTDMVDHLDSSYAEVEVEPIDFPYGGTWLSNEETFVVFLFTENEQYQIQAGDYVETGWYTAFQNTEEDMIFPEEYPASDYVWWMISTYPEQIEGGTALDQDALKEYREMGSYISVYQSRSNPEEIYFYNEFGDVPWMAQDEFYPVTQVIGEQETNDLLLENVEPDITTASEAM